MNKKGKKENIDKQIILSIIRDIKLKINYENKILEAIKFLGEKTEIVEDDEKKVINNFSSYKNVSILLKDEETKIYLICRLFFNNPYESLTYNKKVYKSKKIELNSFKYEIAFDYYFVNRTNLNLYVNNKVIEGANTKSTNFLIPANNYIPVSKTILNNKIKLKVDDILFI